MASAGPGAPALYRPAPERPHNAVTTADALLTAAVSPPVDAPFARPRFGYARHAVSTTNREVYMSDEPVERGAAEELSEAPLTETEVQASRRPPSGGGPDEPHPVDDAPGSVAGDRSPQSPPRP
jgi:hypothetical protein